MTFKAKLRCSLEEKVRGQVNQDENKKSSTHHSFIPDEGHPLLHSIDTFWDLSEVILANSLLGHTEGTVSAASHTQVSTGEQINIELKWNYTSTAQSVYARRRRKFSGPTRIYRQPLKTCSSSFMLSFNAVFSFSSERSHFAHVYRAPACCQRFR